MLFRQYKSKQWRDEVATNSQFITFVKCQEFLNKYFILFLIIDSPVGTVVAWINSDKYFGEFQDGKRHGKGRYYYSDGDQHFGDWKYDLKHGFGNLFDSKGKTKLMGDWTHGKPPESSCLIS